ncbi:hypothetical protein [Bacteroides sp. 51]|uniref:hypothetical protein n=1 Tax=Bacteroides sp. 51 TaxID=2302938 RepID=UPI0013D677F0|nr:hypothetical protein [Bacteroides sp. 51]NDV81287.1 hypothetical protein [Bacteroides sp. 51]
MEGNKQDLINLIEIKEGLPGMHPDLCGHYYSACMTTLHRMEHPEKLNMALSGDRKANLLLTWDDYFDEQFDRSWKEINYCTDHAAVCISCLLAINETSYTIVERSCKGDGFDYWLGDKDDILFSKTARLEISGILNETSTNTPEQRLTKKLKQTDQSDSTCLPAYVSIVEFSNPRAIFKNKR